MASHSRLFAQSLPFLLSFSAVKLCRTSRMTRSRFIAIYSITILTICLNSVKGDRCLSGPFHKESPGRPNQTFNECQPWQTKACCTPQFTESLLQHETKKLYNHSWHLCGPLSLQCQQFWVMQECFYQCSPFVTPFEDPDYKGGLKGVPICSRHCDSWYDACKDDQICVENVLTDYKFTSAGENKCPSYKPCMTYKQMYGSGEALCNKMWGNSYTYTQENKYGTNCMSMWFDPTNGNPNAMVKDTSKDNEDNNSFAVGLKAPFISLACLTVIIVYMVFTE